MNQHVIDFLRHKFEALKADPTHTPMDLLTLAVEISKYLGMNV